jgi:hypothetical protein
MARSLLIALAIVGMTLVAEHAQAGRRGGCSGGSCGVVYSAAPAPAAPATAATPVPADKPAVASTEAAPVRTTTVSNNVRNRRFQFFSRRR